MAQKKRRACSSFDTFGGRKGAYAILCNPKILQGFLYQLNFHDAMNVSNACMHLECVQRFGVNDVHVHVTTTKRHVLTGPLRPSG